MAADPAAERKVLFRLWPQETIGLVLKSQASRSIKVHFIVKLSERSNIADPLGIHFVNASANSALAPVRAKVSGLSAS